MNGALLTQAVIGLIAIVLIYHFGIVRLRRDRLRSDIRVLRDELFDYMWQNGYSFESEPYQRARQTLNGMLMCSNYITPVMFLSLACLSERFGMKPESDLSRLDPALRKKIELTMSKAIGRINHFLFLEGALGLLIRSLLLAIRWASFAGSAKRWVQDQGQASLACYHTIGAPWRHNGPSMFPR